MPYCSKRPCSYSSRPSWALCTQLLVSSSSGLHQHRLSGRCVPISLTGIMCVECMSLRATASQPCWSMVCSNVCERREPTSWSGRGGSALRRNRPSIFFSGLNLMAVPSSASWDSGIRSIDHRVTVALPAGSHVPEHVRAVGPLIVAWHVAEALPLFVPLFVIVI